MISLESIKRLGRCETASMAIETAIVAPLLVIMTLGTFEVGTVVARQHELQSAANEAEIIITAVNRGATIEVDQISEILQNSVDLTAEDITIEREFRCNQQNGKVKDQGNCPENSVISEYISIAITDSYTPTWTAFGVGQEIEFGVERSVQIQ